MSPDGYPIPSGCLAPWQCRRLRAYIDANLSQPLVLSTLADVVSLSTSHFCRAFRQSFGVPPHQFVMQRRLEHAQQLMLSTSESLSSIALSCGLADQSHLTRWFRRSVGQTPAMWRRVQREI